MKNPTDIVGYEEFNPSTPTPWLMRPDGDPWFDEVVIHGSFGDAQSGAIARLTSHPYMKRSSLSGNEWRVSFNWTSDTVNSLEERHFITFDSAIDGLVTMLFMRRADGDFWKFGMINVGSVDFKRKERTLYTHAYKQPEPASVVIATLPWLLLEASEEATGYAGWDECQQTGCPHKATKTLRLKSYYLQGMPFLGDEARTVDAADFRMPVYLNVCDAHAKRGDSDRTDNDENYEVLPLYSPKAASPASSEPSASDPEN